MCPADEIIRPSLSSRLIGRSGRGSIPLNLGRMVKEDAEVVAAVVAPGSESVAAALPCESTSRVVSASIDVSEVKSTMSVGDAGGEISS